MKSRHLGCMMWNVGWLWSECRGIGLHLELIWGTLRYFPFLRLHQGLSRILKVFLVTLWSSIKEIKAPYVFDGYMELLCMQSCRIWPHLAARAKSHGFSRVAVGTWHMISSYSGDELSKHVFVQRREDPCLVMRDTSGISSRFGRATQKFLAVSRETQ